MIIIQLMLYFKWKSVGRRTEIFFFKDCVDMAGSRMNQNCSTFIPPCENFHCNGNKTLNSNSMGMTSSLQLVFFTRG